MTPTLALMLALGTPAPVRQPPRRPPPAVVERGPCWGRDVAAKGGYAGLPTHATLESQAAAQGVGRERAEALTESLLRARVPIAGSLRWNLN